MSDWKKQSEHIEVSTYAIVKTRKKDGKWEYKELEAGVGDWSDLVFVLWETYEQFQDQLTDTFKTLKAMHEGMDALAATLAKKGEPYEFKLADGTDEWIYAFCRPATYRIDHEGKLG